MKRRMKALALTLAVFAFVLISAVIFWHSKDRSFVLTVQIFSAPFIISLALAAIAQWLGKDFTKPFGSPDVPPLSREGRERR